MELATLLKLTLSVYNDGFRLLECIKKILDRHTHLSFGWFQI